ncbi:hypothetical protein TNCV_4363351 [Trichonephila clavipes]|nr:hypothetical protein TNCV_4363351 [Trichonephila clavipes]
MRVKIHLTRTKCSRLNGRDPLKQHELLTLDPINARITQPRLSFMQIHRLRYDCNDGIIGQVINVPGDVGTMLQQLTRQLDGDQATMLD